jgi:hypothetical protein
MVCIVVKYLYCLLELFVHFVIDPLFECDAPPPCIGSLIVHILVHYVWTC